MTPQREARRSVADRAAGLFAGPPLRVAALGAALVAASATYPAEASDFYHVCRTADGLYEMNDEVLFRVAPSGDQSQSISYRKIRDKTLKRETGYCIVNSEGGKKFNYESRTYTLRVAFQDEGRQIETDFICEFASDGLPAAYTCNKQVVVSREGESGNVGPPAASGGSLWMHNGSVMRLEASGTDRRFYYEIPRSGMLKAGARPGTLLFEGTRDGAIYSGVAYIFAKGCEPAPYAVAGEVSADDRRITMTGTAPRLAKDCSVTGTREDTLVFSFRPDLDR